jgi:predicted  nucleic acid-binding Zn-ribbon protein
MRGQLELFRQQKPRLEAEIQAIKEQIAAERARLDLVNKEVDQSTQNVKQGLGLRSVEVNLRLEQATQEGRLWQFVAQISRLRMDSGELDIKVGQVEATYRIQAIAELQSVRDRLAELRITLPAAVEIREVRRQHAAHAVDAEATWTMSITRVKGGNAVVFKADEWTPLQPGDVVDITRMAPQPRSARIGSSEQPGLRQN